MLSCIVPFAIMQQFAIMQPFAIMQNIIYHVDYTMLSCRVPYAIMRSIKVSSELLPAAKANILSSSFYYCFLKGFAF